MRLFTTNGRVWARVVIPFVRGRHSHVEGMRVLLEAEEYRRYREQEYVERDFVEATFFGRPYWHALGFGSKGLAGPRTGPDHAYKIPDVLPPIPRPEIPKPPPLPTGAPVLPRTYTVKGCGCGSVKRKDLDAKAPPPPPVPPRGLPRADEPSDPAPFADASR